MSYRKISRLADHIKALHFSASNLIFNKKKIKIFKKWKELEDSNFNEFKKYFEKQWINGVFSNWSIFHSPPGFSTTNNPVESCNATIIFSNIPSFTRNSNM